jgi:D-amino-acid dehydrogenase
VPSKDDVREIGPDDARALFPPLGRPLRALHDRTAARVDGRLIDRALLRAGARRGLEVVQASAERLVLEGRRVTGVVAGGHRRDAGQVVIAGGAWSPALGDQLGVRLPVAPQRGQIAHLQVAGAATGTWPVVHGFRDHYMVCWDGGRVVAGASRETGSGFDPRVTAGGVRHVLDEALRVAPGLAGADLLEVRVGLRPLSADGLPVLGAIPGVAGVLLATGHGPSGLTLGPYSARLVCDLLLGRPAGPELAPFSVTRW